MTPQLYVQSITTFQVIANVIQHGTMFYSQRAPKELTAFHWIIDGKDKTRITDWEDWWSYVVRPFLQSTSLRKPMAQLHGADYSYFEKFIVQMPDHSKPHLMESKHSDGGGIDANLLMTESFKFSSTAEPGLELVDILVNATRRALMGNLDIRGWRDIPHVMIHRRQHYIHLVALHDRSPSRGYSYMPVLRHFSSGGKNMFAPRFARQLRETRELKDYS